MDSTQVKECVNFWWRQYRDLNSIIYIPEDLINVIFLFIKFIWERLDEGDQELVVCTERIGYNCFTYQAVKPLLKPTPILLHGSNGFFPYQLSNKEIFITLNRNNQIPFYYYYIDNQSLLNFGITTSDSSSYDFETKTTILPVSLGVHVECEFFRNRDDHSVVTHYFVSEIGLSSTTSGRSDTDKTRFNVEPCDNFMEARFFFDQHNYVHLRVDPTIHCKVFADKDKKYYLFLYISSLFKNFSVDIGIREYDGLFWNDKDWEWTDVESNDDDDDDDDSDECIHIGY